MYNKEKRQMFAVKNFAQNYFSGKEDYEDEKKSI